MVTDIAPTPPVRHAPDRRLTLALLLGSAATAALALAPTSTGDSVPLLEVLAGPTAATITATTAGIVGALLATFLLRRPATPGIILLAAAVAAVFGIGMQSVGTLAYLGYLVATAAPVLLMAVVVQAIRRYRIARWPVLLATIALLGYGIASGALAPDNLRTVGGNLLSGYGREITHMIAAAVHLGLAIGWTLLVVRAVAGGDAGLRFTAWTVRHRRPITMIAALGPLPYAFERMTWLTPWPQFAPPADEFPLDTRLWGLLLGAAAVGGVVMTLGLIRPWGERFPRWFPVLAGRPVPIAAAAVPGAIVAAAITAAAVPMILLFTVDPQGTMNEDASAAIRLAMLVVFPCWFWGPALALAVWGYVGHRRGDRPISAA